MDKIVKTDAEWRAQLTEEQYRVTRHQGTECAFTGAYWNVKEDGMFECVCCGLSLFDTSTKFNSGTGWPSFWKAVDDSHVSLIEDVGHGMRRIEATCARCDAHLGHLFPDGPRPTGLRFCMNSASLKFTAKAGKE